MSHYCRRCEQAFDSRDDDPRCPRCLRKSSVVADEPLRQTEPPVAVFPYAGLRGSMVLGVLAGVLITGLAVVSLVVGLRGPLTFGLLLLGSALAAGCGYLARRWLRDPPVLAVYADRVVVPVGMDRTPRVVPFSRIARLSPPIDLGTQAGRVLTLDLDDDDRVVVSLGDDAETAREVYGALADAHDAWQRYR